MSFEGSFSFHQANAWLACSRVNPVLSLVSITRTSFRWPNDSLMVYTSSSSTTYVSPFLWVWSIHMKISWPREVVNLKGASANNRAASSFAPWCLHSSLNQLRDQYHQDNAGGNFQGPGGASGSLRHEEWTTTAACDSSRRCSIAAMALSSNFVGS